jgi:hypothetical protein
MGVLTQIYVDPSLDSDSGTGTSGDPYGDLQYALNTATRDGTNGTQINIKAGEPEAMAAILSFAGTFTAPVVATAPLVFRGYAESLNDGGIGIIDGGGGAVFPANPFTQYRDLHIRNGGSATLVAAGSTNSIVRCKIENTSGIGINLGGINGLVSNCEITDCGEGVVAAASSCSILNNYFKFGATRNFTSAVKPTSTTTQSIERNIFSMGTSGIAIDIQNVGVKAISNSIFANGSSGAGIAIGAVGRTDKAIIINNVIEGFSDTGGRGISFINTTTVPLQYAHNACFNNETNYHQIGDAIAVEDVDNEVLTASPFAKSGADTFANRFAYFSPVDTGNIRGGAIQ